MAAKTRTPLQRERDLRLTASLYLRGLVQHEIAQRLGVSRQQVGYDLTVLRRRWQESALADFHAKKADELAKADELERTYWEAWERSCQARETSTQERTQGAAPADGGRLRAGVRKESRDGNPDFLRGVERCIEMRCKILGAFAALKVAPTTPDGQEEWHATDADAAAVLAAALARLGLAVGPAGGAGPTDDPGPALGAAGDDPAAGGPGPGPLADRRAADAEGADPAPLFPPGG
jgi:hypothetical protein